MARMLRALSGKTQEQTAEEIGVHPSLIAQIELGRFEPSSDQLERLAQSADLTLPDADEILRLAETLRRSRRWQSSGIEGVAGELMERLRSHVSRAQRHLLTLPHSDTAPRPEDRLEAGALLQRLKGLSEDSRVAVVRVADELQIWALCEEACKQSLEEAPRDIESAISWARLAREIAERVRGTEGWCSRLQAYAAAHEANALRMAGELAAAAVLFQEATHLWQAGSDPIGLLDPGGLLEPDRPAAASQER